MYRMIRVIFYVFMNMCDFLCLHENNKNIFNYIIENLNFLNEIIITTYF